MFCFCWECVKFLSLSVYNECISTFFFLFYIFSIFWDQIIILFEPVHDKTNNLGFRPGPTQTSLYSHRRNPES